MALVDDNGLVGKVVATSSGYAVGQILFNKELRISAKDPAQPRRRHRALGRRNEAFHVGRP